MLRLLGMVNVLYLFQLLLGGAEVKKLEINLKIQTDVKGPTLRKDS